LGAGQSSERIHDHRPGRPGSQRITRGTLS
jgi:hypothetical protein